MKYLLMIVLLFSFNQARADFLTGNELLEMCEEYLSDTGSPAKGHTCMGYVIGIADAEDAFVDWKLMGKKICNTNTMSSQIVRVVIKYLQENPQNLHKSAGSLVANALSLAFPCE